MKAYMSELFGTFCLVLIGCGSVVLGGLGDIIPNGSVSIGLSFGIAVVAMAYAIGPVSGAHLNPAVTLGAFLAGRIPFKDVIPYMVAQTIGGILAAIVLYIISSGSPNGAPAVLAANGWGGADGYGTGSAFLAEFVGTFVFVTVILGVTNSKHTTTFAGLVIGLTLAALHFNLIPVTGTSLNPARSIGPALFSGSASIAQLWLFILAPLAGAALAGVVAKMGIFEKDD